MVEKMVEVVTKVPFKDIVEKETRTLNEKFKVTKERAEELKKKKWVKEMEKCL